MLYEHGYPQQFGESPLYIQSTVYYVDGEDRKESVGALVVIGSEADDVASAVYVVDNEYLIVPSLDANGNLVEWTKQKVTSRSVIETDSSQTFICDIQENSLSQLIGSHVEEY